MVTCGGWGSSFDSENGRRADVRFRTLVVLVPARPLDVVPAGGLMTQEALVDPRLPGARDRARDHLEVHHPVTRRRLMTLHALHRTRWRVSKRGNAPRRRAVTRRAIAAEITLMPILRAVARDTGEGCFDR